MKAAISLLLFAVVLFSAGAVTPPAFDWQKPGSASDAQFRQFQSDGSIAKRPLPVVQDETLRKPVIVLDGKTMLAIRFPQAGAQTVRVLIQYPVSPTGAVISRHRTEDGRRGFEMGFGSKNPYELDGNKPTGQVSAGHRDSIRTVFGKNAPELKAGRWYVCILRFSPAEMLTLAVLDHQTGGVLYLGQAECPGVEAIIPEAGDGLLGIGGRRNNSKNCSMLAPAGTRIGGVTVWKDALSDEELGIAGGGSGAAANPAPVTRYVDGSAGDDRNDGLSPEKPLRTIQRAADQVNPGDTVRIAPGVYFETVELARCGTAAQPITFTAAGGPGSVILTAADRAIREKKVRFELVDGELGIYSAPCDRAPSRVLCSEIDLYPYTTMEGLKSFLVKKGYPAPENGFYFDEAAKKLYVRLPAGRFRSTDPNDHLIAVSPPFAPGYNGHHIYQKKDANFFISPRRPVHVILSGFTFETPGSAGVVTGGSNVVVRDSFFKGCRAGVWGFNDAAAVFVENCHYDQAAAYDDVLDTIAKWGKTDIQKKHFFYFWARKGGANVDTDKMKNYETGIVGGVAANWHVRNNVIENSFEGLSCWCVDWAKHLQIYGNSFRRIVDNAIETENHASDVRIFNNRFEDVFEPLSWQPLGGRPWPGPVYIYRNIVTCTPGFKQLADGLNPKSFRPGVFKIGVSGSNWKRPEMGGIEVEQIAARVSKRFVMAPDPGFLAFNNTLIWPFGNLFTTPQPVVGRAVRDFVNFRFFNNIFAVDRMHKLPEWRGSLIEFYANLEIGNDPENPHTGIIAGDGGVRAESLEQAGVSDTFQLEEKSMTRGRGILYFDEPDASADLGAVPAGWKFEITAGPGTAVDLEKLSPFARKVFYHPTLIRTAGPVPGRWGVWSDADLVTVDLGRPQAAPRGARILFRLTEAESSSTLLRNGAFSIQAVTRKGAGSVKVANGEESVEFPLGTVSRDLWQTLEMRFSDGKVTATLNGVELKPAQSDSLPAPKAAGNWRTTIGRNPLFDVELLP